jgi:hypothetical protein
MPYLSYDKGTSKVAIAVVRGGDKDGKIAYIHEGKDDKKDGKKGEIPVAKYANELKGVKGREKVVLINRLQEALRKDLPSSDLVGEDEATKKLYDKIKADFETSSGLELPDDSRFEIVPSADPAKRDVFYICGASGSGKSYIARGLGEFYRKLFPKREVYRISKLTEDTTIDNMKGGKPKRINVKTLVEDYPEIEEFRDCMVIFDDIDCFTGKELKAVHQLIDDLAITGRHTNTTIMFLTHYITNYKATRLILNETTHFVVYPQSTSFHGLKYLLGTHIGMSKDDIHDLRKLGRWVCIHKNYPQYLVSAHEAKILHQEAPK